MPILLPLQIATALFLVTSFVTIGLLSLWAATSWWHWFARTGVLFACLSILLVIPAHEPLIIFALEAATVVAGVQLWQWRAKTDRDRSAIHFSLKSLLLLTLIVAVVTITGTHLAANMERQTPESWTTILLNGLSSGAAVLLASWIATTRRKRIVLPIAAALCLGLAMVLAWCEWLFPTLTYGVDAPWPPNAASIAAVTRTSSAHPQLAWLAILPSVTLLVLLTLTLWSAAVASVSASIASGNVRRQSPRFAIAAVTLALISIAAFPLLILWQLLNPPPMLTFDTPSPNGFDEIAAAAREFDSSMVLTTRIAPTSTQQLASEAAKYAPSYAKLRHGLSQTVRLRPWPADGKRVPPAWWHSDPPQQVARQAARVFSMEAQLAREQQRYADAARISREILEVGKVAARDGNLTDFLVGMVAMGGIASDTVYPSVAHLPPDECRTMMRSLLDFDAAREPLERVIKRDRVWCQNVLGWHGRVQALLTDITPLFDRDAAIREAIRRNQAVLRMLAIELAVRASRVEQGRLPNSLDELLPSLPQNALVDPFDPAGNKFRYTSTGDTFLLYSVGTDGDDDAGRPWTKAGGVFGEGDLRLDVFLGEIDPNAVSGNQSGGNNSDELPAGDSAEDK